MTPTLLLAFLQVAPVTADSPTPTWTEEQKLIASDAVNGNFYGYAVSLFGDTALVGAVLDPEAGMSAGAAYVYVRDVTSWSEEAKILASDAQPSDQFGYAVALSGETAVVGANFEDAGSSDAGAAYVFVRSGSDWSEQEKLVASDGSANDHFGNAVAIDADTIVIGAEDDSVSGTESGSAYVFVRNGADWIEQVKLVADDGAAFDNFGAAVAIEGNRAIIGAPNAKGTGGAFSGAVYVYVRDGSTWTEEVKLFPSDGANGDDFGTAVCLRGDTLLVGAPSDDDVEFTSGSAYVFVRENGVWTEDDKITASNPTFGASFGASVSLGADAAVVGADDADGASSKSGAVYAFVKTTMSWSETNRIDASDGATDDSFGQTVSLDGDTILVGARGADSAPTGGGGSAYVFRALLAPWRDLQGSLAGSTGGPTLFGTGSLVGGEPVTLSLSNGLPGATATLVVGLSRLDAPFKGGTMIPDVDLISTLSVDPTGSIDIVTDWPAGIPAGIDLFLQYWIIDPGGPKGFSASNALGGTTP